MTWNYLIAKCENLIAGWKKLEATAIENGHKPTDVDVWFAVAPPDQGNYSFALVKHPADLASVSKEDAERAYSMDEVIRIINAWETRMIKEVKEHFPQSQIINIEDFKDDKEIPSKNEQMKELEAAVDKKLDEMIAHQELEAPSLSPRQDMLRTVERLVSNNRNLDYGEPVQNMARTAEMLAAYLGKRTGRELEATDVAAFGIILKLGRLAENPTHSDSWMDVAGYASIGFECVEKEKSGS